MNNRYLSTIAIFTLPLMVAAAAITPVHAETAATPAATNMARLTINFTDIEEPQGKIMLAIFASEESYNGGKPVRGVMVEVNGNTASTVVEGLSAGRYAFKIMHDIDGDGKMGTNPFGIPTEPFAFSNNAKGSMGPAKWADAAFDLNGVTTQQISFR